MYVLEATAVACANIAFIKYWGKRDAELNLPANSSLSMNLDRLTTLTTVEFSPNYDDDLVILDGREETGAARQRIVTHLDRVRAMAGLRARAKVVSRWRGPGILGLRLRRPVAGSEQSGRAGAEPARAFDPGSLRLWIGLSFRAWGIHRMDGRNLQRGLLRHTDSPPGTLGAARRDRHRQSSP